jgi:hypothetical protein
MAHGWKRQVELALCRSVHSAHPGSATLWMGPVELPPHEGGHDHHHGGGAVSGGLHVDWHGRVARPAALQGRSFGITSFRFDLVGVQAAAGTVTEPDPSWSSLYDRERGTVPWLHHVNLFNPRRANLVTQGWERVAGAGDERTFVDLVRYHYFLRDREQPFDGGMWSLGADEDFWAFAGLMNPTPDPWTVFVRCDLGIDHCAQRNLSARVTPLYFDVSLTSRFNADPTDPGTGVNPPSSSVGTMTVERQWTPRAGGRMVFAAGHAHLGGTTLYLRTADGTEELARLRVRTGLGRSSTVKVVESIETIGPDDPRSGASIRAHASYTVGSTYSLDDSDYNDYASESRDVMGLVAVAVVDDEPVEVPRYLESWARRLPGLLRAVAALFPDRPFEAPDLPPPLDPSRPPWGPGDPPPPG